MATGCTIFPECESCEQPLSCFRKIAGILSDEEIRHFRIVRSDDASSHNPTVYDLRLGDYHYLYSGGQDTNRSTKWKAVYLGNKTLTKANEGWEDPSDRFEHPNDTDHTKLVIPPLGSALIELYEIIDTDTVANQGILVTGRFDLKLSLVNKGLISQQGTQIEPCYKGRMYCFIHNLSGEEIALTRHQTVASIEFSYVSCFCKREKREEIIASLRKKNHDDQRYPFAETCNIDKGITNIRYFKQKRQLPDVCGLYSYGGQINSLIEKHVVDEGVIRKIKDKINLRMELLRILIPAVASIIAVVIGGYFGIVKPLFEYKDQISSLQTQVEEFEVVKEEWENFISSYESQSNPDDDIVSGADESLGD